MGIKIVADPPYSPDLAPCDFWLFPKLKEKFWGCRYETIEEMKDAVTKVIDTHTQADFHGALQKLLERYNKCIAAGGDYFEGDYSFMCVLSIKVPIQKKTSGNLFNDPRTHFNDWQDVPWIGLGSRCSVLGSLWLFCGLFNAQIILVLLNLQLRWYGILCFSPQY